MAKKICRDCKKEFEAKSTSRYPRKYCEKCSAQRKKDYENIYKINAEDCEE